MSHLAQLGAQKFRRDPKSEPGIRFGVYAPNALEVEVVFGLLWKQGDQKKKPVNRLNPAPYHSICGGYIADDGTGMDSSLPAIPMTRQEDGCWFSDTRHPDLQTFSHWDHVPYMFRITRNDGTIAYRTDLYSRCQIGAGHIDPKGSAYDGLVCELAGTKSCSVIVDPDTVTACFDETILVNGQRISLFPETRFISQEEFWKDEWTPDKPLPSRLEDCVIYQLHIPVLGFGKEIGTIEDAIRHLDYIVELGVNAVELLPVCEYGLAPETWGYSTSHHHAIEFSGGGRDKMKYFIKAAHQRGIAVIFDVVYNHYAHDAERAQWMYDTNDHEKNVYYWYHGHPFDYPDRSDGPEHCPGSGGYLNNLSTGFAPRYHDPHVRNLLISSARALVREFHVDGFRVDQTTSIHCYNTLNSDGSVRDDANEWGGMFLREWVQKVREVNPNIFLTAEDHSNHDIITRKIEENGFGFDAAWYADFHHHLVGANYGNDYAKLIPTAGYGGDGPLAMDYFAGALQATSPQKVVYHISHDEAGNAGRENSDPDKRSHRTMSLAVHGCLNDTTRSFAEARSRAAFAVALFSAGVPLFLFGEEVAFENDFLCDTVLSLREDFYGRQKGEGEQMFQFYHDAIRLRQSEPTLRSPNLEILHVHNENRILAFRRWNATDELLVVLSLNNAHFLKGYVFEHPSIPNGKWTEILNSDLSVNGGTVVIGNHNVGSVSGRIEVFVPANSILVLKRN